jgi:hypothetical protein
MACVNPTQVLNLLQRLVTPKNFIEEAPALRSLTRNRGKRELSSRNRDECSVLEGACQQLWDITVEEKVCEFLTGAKMSKGLWLVFEKRLLADPRSDRLLELSIGILANLTCFARSRLILIKQDAVVSLLIQYLMTSNYPGVLNEILRCLHGLVHCIDKKVRKQFLQRIFTRQPCLERILELYSNSLNHDVLYGCILFIHDLLTTVKETRAAEIAGANNFTDCLLENIVMEHQLDDYFDKTFGVLLELTNSKRFPNVAQVVVETLVNTPRVLFILCAHIQNRTPPSLKAFLFFARIVDHTPNKKHILPLLDSTLLPALLQSRHIPGINIIALLAIFQRIAAEALNQRAGFYIKVIKENPQIDEFLKEMCHEERIEQEEGSLASQLTTRQKVERTLAKNALHNFAVFLTTVHHSEGGLEKKPEPEPLDIPPPPIPADQIPDSLEVQTPIEGRATLMITAPSPKPPIYARPPIEQPVIGPPERPVIGLPEQPVIGPPSRPEAPRIMLAPTPRSSLGAPPQPQTRPLLRFRPKIGPFQPAKPPISRPPIANSPNIAKPVKSLKKTKDLKPVTRKTQRRRTIATPDILVPQRSAVTTKKRKATAISRPPSRPGPSSVLENDRAAVKRLKEQKGKKQK